VTTNTSNFDNPLILAVETSGRMGSVALAQGDKLLSETSFSGPMRHSAEIFPAITDLLSRFDKKPDQIEQVYISAGPGSFTGLRIAVTFAKTLALANNAEIVAVDTLDCIAANVNPQDKPEQLGVILDAKRSQFFIAVYEQTPLRLVRQAHHRQAQGKQDSRPQTPDLIWKKVLADSLMTAEEFLARFSDRPIMLAGEGLVFYKDKFVHKNISVLDEKFWNPSAANVHKLGWEKAQNGELSDPLTLTPNYIRGPDAIVKQR
jgi:tRNA threonylcarbamoyladenosine biosynthesis protein TsaB